FLRLSFSCVDTAPTVSSTLSLHDALPIYHVLLAVHQAAAAVFLQGVRTSAAVVGVQAAMASREDFIDVLLDRPGSAHPPAGHLRSEEHTSELQSRENLVCRLLLEKKKTEK